MIYVLQLEYGKFYVGYTERENGERFLEHFSNEGAEWTKKYKPIQLLEWREGTKDDENAVTLELMLELGWFNVRGGKWCKVNMTSPPNELTTYVPPNVKSAIKSAMAKIQPPKDTKVLPNQINKFKPAVAPKTQIQQQKIQIMPPKTKAQPPKTKIQSQKSNACFRCGRAGHWASDCYAKTNVNNEELLDFEEYDDTDTDTDTDDGCYKCGRNGHWASECYAKTDVYGNHI
jgi:predicted GIY-YIG superfamily endonuclease